MSENPYSTCPTLVSVIIPCRNEAKGIMSCLGSILNQEEPAGGGIEVVVADGMSEDGTREILQQAAAQNPKIRLIDNPGRITPAALNAAIRAAKGSIILRMDAHTKYAPDYIRRCVEALQNSGADNVGGPWVAKGAGDLISDGIAAAFQSPFAVGGASGHDPHYEGPVDTVYLGCWPAGVFKQFGYFDEEMVRNQDDEHNLRIIRGGGKVFQSSKIVSAYHPRASLQKLFKQYMQYGYWKVRVIQKHRIPASIRHLVPGGFVVFLILTGLAGFLSKPAAIIFSITLGFYLFAILGASFLTAIRTQLRLFVILPFVFPCYHFGYGLGFVCGIWDFVIRRRGAQKNFAQLTR